LLTDFVCLYTYEFWLSLCKIVRSSVILLLPLFSRLSLMKTCLLHIILLHKAKSWKLPRKKKDNSHSDCEKSASVILHLFVCHGYNTMFKQGPLLPWSYGSWIYN
jgi:hypothetical protein